MGTARRLAPREPVTKRGRSRVEPERAADCRANDGPAFRGLSGWPRVRRETDPIGPSADPRCRIGAWRDASQALQRAEFGDTCPP